MKKVFFIILLTATIGLVITLAVRNEILVLAMLLAFGLYSMFTFLILKEKRKQDQMLTRLQKKIEKTKEDIIALYGNQ